MLSSRWFAPFKIARVSKSHAHEIEEGDKSNINDSESELYLIIEKLAELVNGCMGVCMNLMISLRIIKVMAKILWDGTFVLTDTMTAQVFR